MSLLMAGVAVSPPLPPWRLGFPTLSEPPGDNHRRGGAADKIYPGDFRSRLRLAPSTRRLGCDELHPVNQPGAQDRGSALPEMKRNQVVAFFLALSV